MTRLLDEAVAAVAALSEERQDEAARLLLNFAAFEPALELTDEDKRELKASLAEEDAGDFATDAEMRAIWAKHGR